MVQRKSLSFCLWKKKMFVVRFFLLLLLEIKSPIALATIQPCNFDHRLVPYKGNQRRKSKKKTRKYIINVEMCMDSFCCLFHCSSLTRSFCSFCLNFSDHSLSLTWCLSGICVGCFVYFSHSYYIDFLSLTLFLYRQEPKRILPGTIHIVFAHTNESAHNRLVHVKYIPHQYTINPRPICIIHKNIKHFLDTV